MNEKDFTEVSITNKVKDTIYHKTLERYCIIFLRDTNRKSVIYEPL